MRRMSEITTSGILKYLVKGVATTRESQRDLTQELADALPNAQSIVVLPVVQGYTVEIEMADLAPFSSTSFEPYVADHILPEAVTMRCEVTGQVQLQLLKAHFR